MRRLWKVSVWAWGLTLAGLAYYEAGSQIVGVGSRPAWVRVEPPPGRSVILVWAYSLHEVPRDPEWVCECYNSRPAMALPNGRYEISIRITTRQSPFGVYRNTVDHQPAACVYAELDNGEQWMMAARVPANPDAEDIICRVADGRPVPEKLRVR